MVTLSRGRSMDHMLWQRRIYKDTIKPFLGKLDKTDRYIIWSVIFNGKVINKCDDWGKFLKNAVLPGDPNVVNIEENEGGDVICACGQETPNIVYIHNCKNPLNEYSILLGSVCTKKYATLLECTTRNLVKQKKCNDFIKSVNRQRGNAEEKQKIHKRKSKKGIKLLAEIAKGEIISFVFSAESPNGPCPNFAAAQNRLLGKAVFTSSEGEEFKISGYEEGIRELSDRRWREPVHSITVERSKSKKYCKFKFYTEGFQPCGACPPEYTQTNMF